MSEVLVLLREPQTEFDFVFREEFGILEFWVAVKQGLSPLLSSKHDDAEICKHHTQKLDVQ